MSYIKCRRCGELFKPSQESVELWEEGYITQEEMETCDEHAPFFEPQTEFHSDADPGL